MPSAGAVAAARTSNSNGMLLLAWAAQLLSTGATAVMTFGLSIWTYENTGSLIQFSMTVVLSAVPALLVGPWAGAVADRADRRRVIAGADCANLCAIVVLALLLGAGRLQVWHIYAYSVLSSMTMAFRMPAYRASVSMLVPKGYLARASAMIRLSSSVASIGAPLLSGALLGTIGLAGLVALNVPVLVLSLTSLWLVRWPSTDKAGGASRKALTSDALREAVAYLRSERGLLAMTVYGALFSFVVGLVMVLYRPMILSSHPVQALASVQAAGGAGALAGSLLIIALSPARRLVTCTLAADIAVGVTVAMVGALTSTTLLACVMFLSTFTSVVADTCTQAFWQRQVPNHLQGRIFSLNQMLMTGGLPLAAIVGSLLADHFFEPWLMPGGLLSDTVGIVTGTGKGRGIGLMFVLAGAVTGVLALACLMAGSMRRLDRLLDNGERAPGRHRIY